MVELGSGIGVEGYLTVMPVALADVADVENTRCMTTTLDLKKISGGHLVALVVRIDAPSLFAYRGSTPVQNRSRGSILQCIP
jgi:hypothetical protein